MEAFATGSTLDMHPGISESGSAHEAPRSSRALLEREREQQRIELLIEGIAAGDGRLVLVEGPTGIGKTALVSAAAALCAARGVRAMVARASELERDFAFGVVRQWLEPVLESSDPASRERLLAGAAELSAPIFDPRRSGRAMPDLLPSILHGLYWLVSNLAARQPLLLAVDDAQWADEASLRLLNYLAPRLESASLGLVVACRPPELHEDDVLLARLASHADAELIRPEPLSPDGVAALLARHTEHHPDKAFVDACRAATGGNPFFVCELARTLAEDHVIPSAAAVDRIENVRPHTLSRAILARLSQPARALLQALAILDDPAELRLAAELAGQDVNTDAVSAASEAQSAGLVADQRPLRFTHAILRAAVLSSLPAGRRAVMHRRAAELLEASGASIERVTAHLLLAEPAGDGRVVDILRRAATLASARGAPDIAARELRRALDEPPEQSLLSEILRELGQAECLARAPGALEHLQLALESSHDPVIRARIMSELADAVFNAGRWADTITLLQQALRELGDRSPDDSLRLQSALLTVTALDARSAGQLDPELPRLNALAQQRRAAARSLQLTVALLLAMRAAQANEVLTLVQLGLDAGRFIAEETADAIPAIHALDALVFIDELDHALDLANAMLADAAARGSALGFVAGSASRAYVYLRSGSLARAEADGRAALELAREHQLDLAIPFTVSYLTATLRERGQLDEAARLVEHLSLPPDFADTSAAATVLDTRARSRLAHGDRTGAADDLRRCGEICEGLRVHNPNVFGWRSALALATAIDHPQAARTLVERELEDANAAGSRRAIGIALRTRAALARGDHAIELLRGAVSHLEASQARLEHAVALVDLGAALRRAGHRSDCVEPLRRGLELGAQADAPPVVQRAQQELAAIGVRQPKRHDVRDRLTPSEQRITEMAARGASNPEIAQALFLTIKTVEGHLTNAYRKLGIAGRNQLPGTLCANQ